MRVSLSLFASAAVVAEGFNLRSTMREKLRAKDSAANVFAANQLPEHCGGMTTLNDEEAAWVKDYTNAIRHPGVRKSAPEIFMFEFGCWYAKLKKSKCGGLPARRTSNKDAMALEEACKDPTIGFKKLFSTKALVNKPEQTYILDEFPNQRDLKGEEKEGLYSKAMDISYKVAGKEMLCMMLKFIDDGCVTKVYGKAR